MVAVKIYGNLNHILTGLSRSASVKPVAGRVEGRKRKKLF